MEKTISIIKDLIYQVTGLEQDEIDESENLFILGIDSIMLIDIEDEIEAQFNVNIPVDRLADDIDTIEKIAQYIMEERGSEA